MAMGSVEILVEGLMEAETKFEADFESTKMHRFPAGLRRMGIEDITPMVVAIGPYHHGALHLQKMEEVKCAAAYHYITLMVHEKLPEKIYKEARGLYADDAMVVGMEDADDEMVVGRKDADDDREDAKFRKMMFLDACFLLLYMDVSYRRFCDDERSTVSSSLRRFLFSYRGSIDNDIMLLENQLPWLVVVAVMDSLQPTARSTLMESVGNFIVRMGNTFKIRQDAEIEDFVWETNRPPAPHLLGLFRRHKTEPGSPIKWPELNHISASSAIELAQMGIKLTASKTAAFTDMDIKRKWPLSCELSLAPLSLNDARARCLINMAAFELSTASSYDDDPNSTAVCSYLALFAMFMAREDDVQELRSKRIFHGHYTNTEMLSFFNGVMNHLPDSGCRFAHIMAHIVDYKKKRCMPTRVHKFFYVNCGAIVQVLTIVTVLGGLFQLLLSLNKGQGNHGQYLTALPS